MSNVPEVPGGEWRDGCEGVLATGSLGLPASERIG